MPMLLQFLNPAQRVAFVATGSHGQGFGNVLSHLEQDLPESFQAALGRFQLLEGRRFNVPGPIENPCRLTALAMHSESVLNPSFVMEFWNLPEDDQWPIDDFLAQEVPSHDSWQTWLVENNDQDMDLVILLIEAERSDLLWFPGEDGLSVVAIFFHHAWYSGSMIFEEQFVDPSGPHVS